MFLKDAIRGPGVAVRERDGQSHYCHFIGSDLWLFVAERGILQVAAKGGRTVEGTDWQECHWEDAHYRALLEQFNRPVQRVGRICDILVEDEPALIEVPGGKTLVHFDGKRFAMDLALDEFSLFDRGWKLRSGRQRLQMVT